MDLYAAFLSGDFQEAARLTQSRPGYPQASMNLPAARELFTRTFTPWFRVLLGIAEQLPQDVLRKQYLTLPTIAIPGVAAVRAEVIEPLTLAMAILVSNIAPPKAGESGNIQLKYFREAVHLQVALPTPQGRPARAATEVADAPRSETRSARQERGSPEVQAARAAVEAGVKALAEFMSLQTTDMRGLWLSFRRKAMDLDLVGKGMATPVQVPVAMQKLFEVIPSRLVFYINAQTFQAEGSQAEFADLLLQIGPVAKVFEHGATTLQGIKWGQIAIIKNMIRDGFLFSVVVASLPVAASKYPEIPLQTASEVLGPSAQPVATRSEARKSLKWAEVMKLAKAMFQNPEETYSQAGQVPTEGYLERVAREPQFNDERGFDLASTVSSNEGIFASLLYGRITLETAVRQLRIVERNTLKAKPATELLVTLKVGHVFGLQGVQLQRLFNRVLNQQLYERARGRAEMRAVPLIIGLPGEATVTSSASTVSVSINAAQGLSRSLGTVPFEIEKVSDTFSPETTTAAVKQFELSEEERRFVEELYFGIIPWRKVREVIDRMDGNIEAAHVVLSAIVEKVTGIPVRQQLMGQPAESILRKSFGPEVSFGLSSKAFEVQPPENAKDLGGTVALSQARFNKIVSNPKALFFLLKAAAALQGGRAEPVLAVAGTVDVNALIGKLTNRNSGLTPLERDEVKSMAVAKLLKVIQPSELNSYIAAHKGGVVTLLADVKEAEGLQGGMHVVFGKEIADEDELLVTALAVLLKKKADQLYGASAELQAALLRSIPRDFPGLSSRGANLFFVDRITELAQEFARLELIGRSA